MRSCDSLRRPVVSYRYSLMEVRIVAMHEWMIGVGFVALLMTPCCIAMRPGADDADDEADGQETAGARSARRLKLL